MILVDLDNILAPTASVNFDSMEIFDHYTLVTKVDNENIDRKETLKKIVNVMSRYSIISGGEIKFTFVWDTLRKVFTRLVEMGIVLPLIFLQPFIS